MNVEALLASPHHAAQRLVAFARARHNLRALLLRLADGESGSGDGCPGRKLYAQAEKAGLTVVEMPVLTELGRSVAGLLGAELSPEDRAAAKWYKQYERALERVTQREGLAR